MYNPKHAVARVVKSLSLRGRIAASVAALAVVGGGSVLAVAGAGAATNACSSNCIDLSFLSTGHRWLLNDAKGSHAVNATVSQQLGSNGGNQGRNEDFEPYGVGTVDGTYCPGGTDPIFTPNQCAVLDNSGLGGDEAYELEYYPYGGDGSGMCVSAWDAQNPVPSGYKARLQPCGQNADSVLIVAPSLDSGHFNAQPGAFWLISGGSSNFSHPVVLTNNGQQQWQNLTWTTVETDGNGGVVNQEVRAVPGPF
jgi:hypothetical protein